jgi:hypothetical protein
MTSLAPYLCPKMLKILLAFKTFFLNQKLFDCPIRFGSIQAIEFNSGHFFIEQNIPKSIALGQPEKM